jgi:hypothetical protein
MLEQIVITALLVILLRFEARHQCVWHQYSLTVHCHSSSTQAHIAECSCLFMLQGSELACPTFPILQGLEDRVRAIVATQLREAYRCMACFLVIANHCEIALGSVSVMGKLATRHQTN